MQIIIKVNSRCRAVCRQSKENCRSNKARLKISVKRQRVKAHTIETSVYAGYQCMPPRIQLPHLHRIDIVAVVIYAMRESAMGGESPRTARTDEPRQTDITIAAVCVLLAYIALWLDITLTPSPANPTLMVIITVAFSSKRSLTSKA